MASRRKLSPYNKLRTPHLQNIPSENESFLVRANLTTPDRCTASSFLPPDVSQLLLSEHRYPLMCIPESPTQQVHCGLISPLVVMPTPRHGMLLRLPSGQARHSSQLPRHRSMPVKQVNRCSTHTSSNNEPMRLPIRRKMMRELLLTMLIKPPAMPRRHTPRQIKQLPRLLRLAVQPMRQVMMLI